MNWRVSIAAALLAFLLLIPSPALGRDVSETITFRWMEEVKVYDSIIPVEVSIPTTLTVEGLPDQAKPGEAYTVKLSATLLKGAQIKMGEESFNIDEALASSKKYAGGIDLSLVKPLVKKVLADIIAAELKLEEGKAKELSSTLAEYTNLELKSSLEVEVEIEGKAAADPRKLKLWFDEPVKGKITIGEDAEEKVTLTYVSQWGLFLTIDFAASVYENPTVGPLISRLSSLIGLPFERDLGKSRGDQTIKHSVIIYVPTRLTATQIGMIAALVAAACIIAIALIIKHPRKPKWL
ncbi:MAG: hypothetical protein QXE22_00425 [Candidatus Bathyarchaeia archaeon]